MIKNIKRPLKLDAETVRNLTESDLRSAAGAGSGLVRTYNSCGPCSTYEDTNCYPTGNSNIQCVRPTELGSCFICN